MKTVYTVCLVCLVFCGFRAQSQSTDSVPYGLSEEQWKLANETWRDHHRSVMLLTLDSVLYEGQILFVNDTALLLYRSDGLYDPAKSDSLLYYFPVDSLGAIFIVKDISGLRPVTRFAFAGAMIGGAVGTALHLLLPKGVYHPVFIAPAVIGGTLGGLGTGAGRSQPVITDTNWICTQQQLQDTAASAESELIRSTYKYVVWQDMLPDSMRWEGERLVTDSSITFSALATPSRKITHVFPAAIAYLTVSAKTTITRYEDPFSTETAYMLNLGYRITDRWSLDGYLSQQRSLAKMNAAVGSQNSMSATSWLLTCSYALLSHDRINTQRFHCTAGIGLAYSSVEITGLSGRRFTHDVFGFACKADLSAFLSRRLAVVLDAQQVFLTPVELPSFDWVSSQTTIAVPQEVIATSYFQAALGLRFHF
jgi:hypothetical protein